MRERCSQQLFGQEEKRRRVYGKHLIESGIEVQGSITMPRVCTLTPPIESHGVTLIFALKDICTTDLPDHAFNVLAIHCSLNYLKMQGAL